jgi:hypothetical protein
MKSYTVPIAFETVGHVFHMLVPEDARHVAQLSTDVADDLSHTRYKVTLTLEWERTHEHGVGPWMRNDPRFKKYAVVTMPGGDYEMCRKKEGSES